VPSLIYSLTTDERIGVFIARPDKVGRWNEVDLVPWLPAGFEKRQLILPGCLSFNRDGQLHGAAQLLNRVTGEATWGHPSSEVLRFEHDGESDRFRFFLVSREDPDEPHWLPSLERPTGFNAIADRPGLLFTAGPAGSDNRELLSNRVFWTS
jgi:hypothetical protein